VTVTEENKDESAKVRNAVGMRGRGSKRIHPERFKKNKHLRGEIIDRRALLSNAVITNTPRGSSGKHKLTHQKNQQKNRATL